VYWPLDLGRATGLAIGVAVCVIGIVVNLVTARRKPKD
jgi:hypothetical protein